MSDAANGPQNLAPGLQSVKYKSILPEGKQSGYKQGEKVTFHVPTDIGYFDGKQSYVNVVVRNTSESSNSGITADYPLAFPAHQGAHALFNRVQLQDTKGLELENIEQYNLYSGILNAYSNDTDTYATISKVEGVAGHNNKAENMAVDDAKVNYFRPPLAETTRTSNLAQGGVNNVSQNFCLPLNLGLFSAFANEHMAYPNLDIGGSRLTIYLEQAKNALKMMSHRFIHRVVENVAGGVKFKDNYVFVGDNVAGEIQAATNTFDIDLDVCDARLRLPDDPSQDFDFGRLGFGVGMECISETGAATGQIETITITAGGKVRLTFDTPMGTAGADKIKVVMPTEAYEIDRIELKVLETIPSPSTLSQIRKAMMNGINYQTTQLTKISTASELQNAVIDIPTSVTRGLSIMAVPVQTAKLNGKGDQDSLVYPQPDAFYAGNDNQYKYQWQIENILIPNRQLELNTAVSTASQNDNPTFYNQQVMALRPMKDAKCLNDPYVSAPVELSNPFFIPILLSPMGSSYSLVDSDPMLRLENTTGTPANILAKLYHIYINHTRRLQANDSGVSISI